MRKIASIFLGWYFLLTNRNNQVAKYRLSICAKCEFRVGIVCGICSCPLIAKARLTGSFDDGCSDTENQRWPAIK